MNRDIRTTLEISGEKQVNAALKEMSRNMAVMNADMRAMKAEYSATDDAQRYFAQRSDLLNDKIKQQEQIVELLSKAVKDSAAKYGDAARQTDDYRIKLSNATASLYKMRQEAEEAAQELEDLGRDSNKIGRQIENGIGDAAEDVSEKLDGMFAKVSADVNALKGSVAFQTAMDVGGFVMDGIQSVMGFVEENDEYNRQIAIARHNVERYGHDWDEAMKLIVDATVITGNRDGAFEAINNLHSTAVEDQQLIEAAADALLGVFLTTGGSLSFESLAEDFRESVVTRVPAGTYAEALVGLIPGIVIEDVEKALGKAENIEDAFNIALAYLTQGGYQSTTKSFEEQNAEFLEAQRKQQELATEWAELAMNLQPIVTGVVDGIAGLVGGINSIIDWLEEIDWGAPFENYMEWWMGFAGNGINNLVSGNSTPAASNKGSLFEEHQKWWTDFAGPQIGDRFSSLFESLFPSAGAEELTTPETQTNFEDAGSMAWTAYTSGILSAAAENPAMQAVLDAEMAKIAEENDAAFTAGSNAMISFANGIADGSVVVMNNVNTLVNQINKALASIAMPAYGYGLGGITGGSLYIGRDSLVDTVSKGVGQRVYVKNYLK